MLASATGRLFCSHADHLLLSLIGIPATGGFFAKFCVFSAALKANLVGLTIIGVLNGAVGAYYYLRIIVMMYMKEPREEAPVALHAESGVGLVVSVLLTLYLGILPGRVLDYADEGAQQMLHPAEQAVGQVSPQMSVPVR
jgi:NADH-quinone oxidoreductase subunit N